MFNIYIKPLEAVLGTGKETGSGEINFCCPFCIKRVGKHDTKFKLYVNPNRFLHNIRGWYYCQRCRATGPIVRILKGHKEPTKQVSEFSKVIKAFKAGLPQIQKPKLALPKDYVEMVKGTAAYAYCKSRGLTDDIIAHYRIGIGTKQLRDLSKKDRREYAGSGRIIFPDYDSEGEICYWVARTYVGHKVKYKNPFGFDARDQVFNLAGASDYKEVIITEGVMSAIAAGRNAVATYGKDVTRTQISMLSSVGFDKYIVALDGDALEKEQGSKLAAPAFRVADSLLKRGHEVYLVRLPYDDDPASVDNFPSYVQEAVKWSFRTSTEVRIT